VIVRSTPRRAGRLRCGPPFPACRTPGTARPCPTPPAGWCRAGAVV